MDLIAVIGIDIGKKAIILKSKLSRGQLEDFLANLPSCLIGMEACSGAHHLSRRLIAFGHDAG
jgi:transposase